MEHDVFHNVVVQSLLSSVLLGIQKNLTVSFAFCGYISVDILSRCFNAFQYQLKVTTQCNAIPLEPHTLIPVKLIRCGDEELYILLYTLVQTCIFTPRHCGMAYDPAPSRQVTVIRPMSLHYVFVLVFVTKEWILHSIYH